MNDSTKVALALGFTAMVVVVCFAAYNANQNKCTTLSAGPLSSSVNC